MKISGNLYDIMKINPIKILITAKTKFGVDWENVNKYIKFKPPNMEIIPINNLNRLISLFSFYPPQIINDLILF